MLKTLIAATAALLIATTAFAQSEKMKSPGSSEYSAGQTMQKSKISTAPGASKYAPGHQKKTAKGHSGSAPGQQTTTGMATKKKY